MVFKKLPTMRTFWIFNRRQSRVSQTPWLTQKYEKKDNWYSPESTCEYLAQKITLYHWDLPLYETIPDMSLPPNQTVSDP